MKTVFFILMTLFFLLASVPWMRIYFRTGLKGALLIGIGDICDSGSPGFFYWFDRPPAALPFLPLVLFVLAIAGLLCFIISFPVRLIKESGAWKKISETTSYWQRFTGNVPILKYEKLPSPSLKRRTGIAIGISLMTGGIIGTIFFRLTMNYFSAGTIFMFIAGLLLIIFSIVYLDKRKR